MSREEAAMFVLRKIVVDGFLFCALLFGIYSTQYLWVPFHRGFFCGDESLMFPYKDDTVPTFMLRLVGLGLPVVTFLICEWALLRKEGIGHQFLNVPLPKWLRGFYCATASFALGACFVELTTNIAKNVIGRPRPHFFDVTENTCGYKYVGEASPAAVVALPFTKALQAFGQLQSDRVEGRYIQPHEYTCTGTNTEKFSDMHLSFLSGHSALSAYTMFYLALYLEKRMVWRGTRALRHSLQFLAVMLSWFTALSRVSDYKHHWSDVLAGYFLGLAMAVLVWTWGTDIIPQKKKHSPLPQHEVSLVMHQRAAVPA